MIETILVVFGVIAAAVMLLLIVASRKPDTFALERSIDIRAPAKEVYPLIAALPRMNTWNLFVEPDPNIEISYSGAEMGTGAVHTWSGNRNVGAGRLEITEAVPPSRIEMRLQMFRPMAADNQIEFKLVPSGDDTRVTWRMSGPQPLIGKVISTFMDCEQMIGPMFDKGLARLKTLAESGISQTPGTVGQPLR